MPPRAPQTVSALLDHRSEYQPDRVAYRFLDYGASSDPEVSEVTYAELDRRARNAAAALAEVGRLGDRVLIMCSPGLPYIIHFYGCLYAGMIAVPAFLPGATRNYERIDAIARDSAAAVVVADGSDAAAAARGLSAGTGSALASARWLAVEDSDRSGPGRDWTPADASPDSLAFLQYTSGSTATPRGVMVSHGNLLANARAAHGCFGLTPETTEVNWVPPYHDMGLIGGVIMPLCGMFTAVHMAPGAFIRSPQRWLEVITRYRAVVSSAPDFAYRMCVGRISEQAKQGLDLTSWKLALNGSEPVSARALEEFAQAFASCGFRDTSFVPCYGLAENTLVVSGKPPGSGAPVVRHVSKTALGDGRVLPPNGPDEAQPLVSCGTAAPGVIVKIVDPRTGRVAARGTVGEVWVHGPSVADGYFRAPEATARTFRRKLGRSPRDYLRTGDLGTFIDGQLYVTGRADDLMIFRGRNVYPQDVEATSSGSDPALALSRCAAFAVDGDAEASLVVVQELPRRRSTAEDRTRLAAAIRRRISEEHGLTVGSLVLAPAGAVPTTSSGKIQRKACRARFLAGAYPEPVGFGPSAAVPEQADGAADAVTRAAADIEYRMRELIAESAGCAVGDVSADEPFAAFGLSSIQAVDVARRLSGWLGREVPATIAWDHPGIGAAAAWLADQDTGTRPADPRPAAVARAAGTRSGVGSDPGPGADGMDGIAVVGLGCRFPGGADSPEAFWDLLVSGRNAVGPVPPDRWDAEAYYDPDPDTPARTYARHGAFINHVRDFDAALFGITPREAASIDPQHRLLLETAWHALEHAAIPPDSLRGTPTGVYIGMQNSDYERLATRNALPFDAYSATGFAPNFAANRLSFAFGLTGPSLVVDTACSSSLVAVHLACQALRNGECDTALAGGVNLLLSPDAMIALTKGRMLSPAGQCHTFDAAADGYVRGEGAGIVVLRRLSTARHNNDPILAIIRGTAINQDGRSNGLTAPSGAAQEDVIRRAMAAAGIGPDQIDYVEAHGTGTALGDPIEIRALTATLTPRTRPLAIGSVKTNIGHLEAAAGIASLAKTILALHHATIPPHLNLTTPNPHIPWNPHLTIPATPQPWTTPNRTAGISSFGFGGTNAHLILQNPPPAPPAPTPPPPPGTPHTITLSAHTPTALQATAANLTRHLTTHPTPLHHLAWATTTRATLPHRAAITTTTTRDLTQALNHLITSTPHPHLTTTHHPTTHTPHITLLAPGHGTRLSGTLAGLYGSDPAITAALDALAPILGPASDPPVSILIRPDRQQRVPTEHIQPALYALTLALAAWWRAHGITPNTVLGHSAGAYAAAALAGIVSAEDGARLALCRGQLIAGLPGERGHGGGGLRAGAAGRAGRGGERRCGHRRVQRARGDGDRRAACRRAPGHGSDDRAGRALHAAADAGGVPLPAGGCDARAAARGLRSGTAAARPRSGSCRTPPAWPAAQRPRRRATGSVTRVSPSGSARHCGPRSGEGPRS